MQIHRQQLQQAAEQGLISGTQADLLWDFFKIQNQDTPGFNTTHILYYLGGMIAIGAMTLFMNLGWERLGGWGLTGIAFSYALAGIALTEYFLHRARLRIPAGITATFVVVLTPLAVYGLQSALGLWPEGQIYQDYHRTIDWRWLMMELATLACGAIMLWRYRQPFLVMPIAVTLWYMSMDAMSYFTGTTLRNYNWELFSVWFGILMVLLALWVDLRSRRQPDFAFWLYLFGVLTFWGSLSSMDSDSELNKLIYCGINLAMIAIGTVLGRRVFAIFGGMGAAGYLSHLAYHTFKDSLLFPIALTLLGLAVIYAGIVWQRKEAQLSAALRRRLPQAVQALLEK